MENETPEIFKTEMGVPGQTTPQTSINIEFLTYFSYKSIKIKKKLNQLIYISLNMLVINEL